MFISHIKEENSKWIIQTNEEHQEGVSKLAYKFAQKFGMGECGKILGLLHDKGKEQIKFQEYIKSASGYNKNINAVRTPHAFVGAKAAQYFYKDSYPLISIPIMGHHAGLCDYADFIEKMKRDIPKDVNYTNWNKINLLMPQDKKWEKEDFHHLIRVLYSCLVDADYLDTENFMDNNSSALRTRKESLKNLLPKLNCFLEKLRSTSTKTEINKLRTDIQDKCKEAASNTPGFYSLTVPTGGGKTISSLVWAINHAVKYGKDRIIIAIPYTSIIVQTASILRNIFGGENVLEHHSGYDANIALKENGDDIDEIKLQQELASENWDYPIIVTTNVELFQSMHANKPSVCRKLHNICNSVLILDEVQMLPTEHLQPIIDCLSTYNRIFNTSILFTTASQPVLNGEHIGCNYMVRLKGLSDVKEIIPSEMNLHKKLRRVNLHFDKTTSSYDQIVQRLTQHSRVLCIVNTRKDAKEIYSRLPQEGKIFHLSRMMCSAHIKKIIEEIKSTLNNSNEKFIRVIATQLIEAGVDIDFPIVFRQEAGLDSILQAAGRCNREGKLGISNSYIFSLNRALPPGSLTRSCSALRNMVNIEDWFDPDTMKDYFIRLYNSNDTFDKANIESLRSYKVWNFELIAKNFQLIEDNGRSVVVNYENSRDIINLLKNTGIRYGIIKELNKYMVNIPEYHFNKLFNDGIITEVVDGIYFIENQEQYDINIGLITENQWLEEILIQ